MVLITKTYQNSPMDVIYFKRGYKIKFENIGNIINSYNTFEGDLSDAISQFKNFLLFL